VANAGLKVVLSSVNCGVSVRVAAKELSEERLIVETLEFNEPEKR
jgi:hypothetical protein